MSEARDIECILVDNEQEALALENNLIKRWQPSLQRAAARRQDLPLREADREKYPRVYVTRRVLKDGATYYGPYFPGSLAYRRCMSSTGLRSALLQNRPGPAPSAALPAIHIHRCLGRAWRAHDR